MLATKKLACVGVRYSSTWQLFGSAFLERPASIVKKFTALEKAYQNVLSQIEVEHSLYSDFELRAIAEKKAQEKQKKSEAAAKLTQVKLAEDILAEWQQELVRVKEKLKYKSVSDPQSLKRNLDEPLTLLVKQNLGKDLLWLFPQTDHKQGETLRMTAERALSEVVGNELTIRTLGNAPCAFYKYKYPKDVQESSGFFGAKIFYFRVEYQKGDIKANKSIAKDHMWATYDELVQNVPEPIVKSIKKSFYVPPNIDFTKFLESLPDSKELEKLKAASKN